MSLYQMIKRQQGSAIALVGIGLVVLLAMTGVVIDVGTVYVIKSDLQKAANAAALSGAQELTNSESAVRGVVGEILSRHNEADSLAETRITMNSRVAVVLDREVPLQFSGLFGIRAKSVEVEAIAELAPLGSAAGVAPVGLDDSIALEFGKIYKLKVDETESSTGNFGILALGGPGASTYEQNLKKGYPSPIRVGDILNTEQGNIVGKTKAGVKERLDNCPYPDDIYHRDCSRILLVPLYKPIRSNGNQIKQVKVTGFAYFYITEPVNDHDKTINGKFIKRTGSGLADPSAADNGAYVIRLTK